jgi:hypothetical protein
MHVQAPTLTTSHRAPLVAVVIALTGAALGAGVIALSNDSDSTAPAVKPAVVKSADARVLDGSPLLRAAASAPAVTISSSQSGVDRVWDGSPILRGTASAPLPRVTSSLAGTTSSQPQFPVRPPEGFHRTP